MDDMDKVSLLNEAINNPSRFGFSERDVPQLEALRLKDIKQTDYYKWAKRKTSNG